VEETGVKALRIRVNAVVGHHVEVPVANAKALGPDFTLRQGLASTTRFTTPELDRLAATLEAALDQAAAGEQVIFGELRTAAWFKKCHFQVTPEIDRALMVNGFLVLGVTLI